MTQVKVNGFELPEDPVSAWSEINAGFFNPDYARTLIKIEHDTILYGSTLAKLVPELGQADKNLDNQLLTKFGF